MSYPSRPLTRVLSTALFLATIHLASAGYVAAALGDCGQPASDGADSCNAACGTGNEASECEVYGPVGLSRCLTDLSRICETDSDCLGRGEPCVHFFGPPQPLVASGVPICMTNYFTDYVKGTFDFASNEATVSA
jgi:hypothetical protein